MSKELVISAASHERRVAILEEGQLVEIYIEREKEFALVGSIYKGKVTRVLPGMQSAFVDIGLDGDAFLYVSDVFENLEDYDHDHAHETHAAPAATQRVASAPQELELDLIGTQSVELLPGESLAKASSGSATVPGEIYGEHHEDGSPLMEISDDAAGAQFDDQPHREDQQPLENAASQPQLDEHEDPDEKQPESNASAPQNFGLNYKSGQNYPPRGGQGRSEGQGRPGNDRTGQNFGRGNDRGNDRGGDGGRNNRFGRRGGRRRGGRPAPGGRNLPSSKYASPQGPNDSRANDQRNDQRGQGPDRGGPPRGFEQRGPEKRGFDNRRSDAQRPQGVPSTASPKFDGVDEPILLPGESLAKYRGKPVAPLAPVTEQTSHSRTVEPSDDQTTTGAAPPSATQQAATLPGSGPRRFTGGLPRWLLADAGAESEAAPVSAEENIGVADDSTLSAHGNNPPRHEASPLELPSSASSADLSDDQIAALASGLVEAKQEEAQEEVQVNPLGGGAIFEEEEEEEEAEMDSESETGTEAETEDVHSAEVSELTDEESEEVEAGRAANRAEAEADAAHDNAEHAAALGVHDDDHAEESHAHPEHESSEGHGDEQHAGDHEDAGHGEGAHDNQESSGTDNSSSEGHAASISAGSAIEDDAILLPGETRAPRSAGGSSAPREEFPRDSARVGGNPRSRFQRPFRSGGRDRGRDNRGGRPDSRGGRPDSRGGRPERSGGSRPGQRFERRPSGPGAPRHDRGHQGGHHGGPSRRPQLISEMLKAGQDVVIQIAKEPLGKKGARITSHVALPGRFLVYMPTIDHIGVSRKIASADNRSRLRRLVGEARGSYPGGFIVRTAAGGATDEEIRADIEFLGTTWNEIKERSEQRKAPSLLHRDLNLVERILRDYVSDDFTAIWIDSEEEFSKVVEFVSRFQPKLVSRVKLYTKETPIFEEFGIQHELDKALRAKVWLKSGGYIVINHTEALVAIDVNTGKFVGKGSTRLEDTIVKTNLEAVKEIVRQIRLRDLGGIIVVDFIDMEERRNRDKVLFALQQALEEDKAPSKALSFNEFGLVCITRKRTKQALERVLCQPCPYCTGSGMVKSIPTLCYEIQAEARKMALAGHEGPNLTLRVHPEIAKALKTRESLLMDELEQTSHKHIIIQSDATLHWEQYDIY
jgi:Rne/Rng family ribonuclease